ncbi:MAG TPA: VanZ family protein [Candidatus Moranbacteria bacterium]|nr:VanZ family protein [Candidatus Moranbacteria bacterium]
MIIAMHGGNERYLIEKISAWALALSWAVVIFLLSAMPGNPQHVPSMNYFMLRKGAHILEYAALSFFLVRALFFSNFRFAELWGVLLALLFAFSDELHQRYVPFREGKIPDVLFDVGGIGLGIFFFSVYCILKERQKF